MREGRYLGGSGASKEANRGRLVALHLWREKGG